MKILTRNLIVICASLCLVMNLIVPARTSAAIGSDFRAGNIISDATFFSGPTMTLSEIQNFLNAKVPICDTWGTQQHSSGQTRAAYGASVGAPAPYTCLKNYTENTPSKPAESGLCNSYTGGNRPASDILYFVSQACGVSVQALIVTLQKEQSLITDDWPWPIQYRSAMGYGCPDTAACDSTYYGFFNQVYNAARQFKRYVRDAHLFNYRAGRNNYIRYNPNAGCGGSNIYIETYATAALYNYTPYQPNTAALNNLYGTGDGCSAYGNRNFWRLYNDWFGSPQLSPAFRSINDYSTVYMNIGPYKVIVPQMAILQDYGISPESIRTLGQSTVDAIPFPPTGSGISNYLGHIIKTPSDLDEDGGSVYLVSAGKRYQITSMDQFANFGLSESEIMYLPSSFIFNIQSAGSLSNFVTSPQGAVFKVGSGTKQIIFEYDTFIQQNPSGQASLFSYFLIDRLASGLPISNRPILFKRQNSSLVYVFANNNFYPINAYDTYRCWGLDDGRIPLYAPPQDGYVGNFTNDIPLSCYIAGPSSSNNHIVSGGKRLLVPDVLGTLVNQIHNSTLYNLSLQLNNESQTLKHYVRSIDSDAIWYLETGTKRKVPSFESFKRLVPDGVSFDTISEAVISVIPEGVIKLADGALVKTPESSTVYGIIGNERLAYGYSEFVGYKNNWNQIETYTSDQLNQSYPATGSFFNRLLVHSNTVYLLDPNSCYKINDSQLTQFNIDKSSLIATQNYDASIAWNLNVLTCNTISSFVKNPGQALVHIISNGQRRAIMTWSAFQSLSGSQNPSANTVSTEFLNSYSEGAPIY